MTDIGVVILALVGCAIWAWGWYDLGKSIGWRRGYKEASEKALQSYRELIEEVRHGA